ncbi:hypothetical protein [Rhizobium gallicum]|uniref:hypothetical protein n=1 Tax=Rhizobium gallicum TaxID=56730 RepID=UPI00093EC20A|nr:hypothetical protein [Rhizobium gallicum]
MASTDNFAFLLPVMMLTFGCTFLLVARFGSSEAHHSIGRKSGHCLPSSRHANPFLTAIWNKSIATCQCIMIYCWGLAIGRVFAPQDRSI